MPCVKNVDLFIEKGLSQNADCYGLPRIAPGLLRNASGMPLDCLDRGSRESGVIKGTSNSSPSRRSFSSQKGLHGNLGSEKQNTFERNRPSYFPKSEKKLGPGAEGA